MQAAQWQQQKQWQEYQMSLVQYQQQLQQWTMQQSTTTTSNTAFIFVKLDRSLCSITSPEQTFGMNGASSHFR